MPIFGRQSRAKYRGSQNIGTGGGISAALKLLRSATHWYDAKDITLGTEQTLPNRGTAGGVATIGSTGGTDTNDPVLLPHTGTHYGYVPRVTGNYFRATGTAASATSSSLEFTARVRPQSVTSNNDLCGTESTHARFRVATNGAIIIHVKDVSLINIGDVSSAVIPGWAAGDTFWVRGKVTMATGLCEYWYSLDNTNDPDAVTWTSLAGGNGNVWTGSLATSELDHFMVGGRTAGLGECDASFFYAKQEWGDGEVKTFDPTSDVSTSSDPDAGQTGWTSSTGETWAVVRSTGVTLQTALVTRGVILFSGVDDYFEFLDTMTWDSTAGKASAIWAGRIHQDNGGTQIIWSNESSTNNGWIGGLVSGLKHRSYIGDGTVGTLDVVAGVAFGDIEVITQVIDDGTVFLHSSDGAVPVSRALSRNPTHNTKFRVGTRASGISGPAAFELFAFSTYNGTALSTEEVDSIETIIKAGGYS